MKAKVVRFHKAGGPEVLQLDDVDLPPPGAGEVQLRQTAIGINYLDTYHRSGHYPLPLPSGCGSEAAGIVEAVGPGVTGFAKGDRVAYQGGPVGSYASHRNITAGRVVKLPAGVSEETAAAIMLKGMTVEYLLNRCVAMQPGQFALMYAAAGGVGLLAGQWAKHLGVKLIGVAAGPEKCKLAAANGYHAVIDRNTEDIVTRVKEITGGAGVPAVYDSVGKATYETTLKCLAPRGFYVSFGATTGVPPPIEGGTLQKHGSLYFTRPTLVTYTASRAELEASAGATFDLAAKGVLKAHIYKRYPLAQAADAHRDLEAGRTSGSSLLVP